MVTALEIINRIDKKFPQEKVQVVPISDVHLGAEFGFIYQYIFGLTTPDMRGSLDQYKTWVGEQLGTRSAGVNFEHWSFEDYEIKEVEGVIADLAAHYGIILDFARMSRDLGIKRPEGKQYYLVVSVNMIPVPLAS
jgi:hypothetical protein